MSYVNSDDLKSTYLHLILLSSQRSPVCVTASFLWFFYQGFMAQRSWYRPANTGPTVPQQVLRRCSKSGWRTVGRLVQRCSQGAAGAPAASNLHSCSPGPEPLQSPPVPPAIGTACPGVEAGDPGSDANAWPSPSQYQKLDRSQDTEPRCRLGEWRAEFWCVCVGGGGVGWVCVWLKLSGLFFTSCPVPHHQWFEGGGGFPEWIIMQASRVGGWGGHVFGSGRSVFRSL